MIPWEGLVVGKGRFSQAVFNAKKTEAVRTAVAAI
jgi:hypothetical protein